MLQGFARWMHQPDQFVQREQHAVPSGLARQQVAEVVFLAVALVVQGQQRVAALDR